MRLLVDILNLLIARLLESPHAAVAVQHHLPHYIVTWIYTIDYSVSTGRDLHISKGSTCLQVTGKIHEHSGCVCLCVCVCVCVCASSRGMDPQRNSCKQISQESSEFTNN